MQAKSALYIGETSETPIGRFWLAVSDLGLVAIEWGLTREQFEAYLVKRFKRSVEYSPEHIREAASQLGKYLAWSAAPLYSGGRLDRAAPLPAIRTESHRRNPLWRNPFLQGNSRTDRPAERRPCRRPRRGDQSHAAGFALSSRHRHGSEIARLRPGARGQDQGMVVENGRRLHNLSNLCFHGVRLPEMTTSSFPTLYSNRPPIACNDTRRLILASPPSPATSFHAISPLGDMTSS